MRRSPLFWLLAFALLALLPACGGAPVAPTATATLFFVTATLPPTATPPPSPTPAPPEPTATPRAFAGVTLYPVNVRAEPGPYAEVLGILAQNATIEIIGRNEPGTWWQIRYQGGSGWVAVENVQTSATDVPVAGALPTAGPDQVSASVRQRLNVRSGPGTNFDSLGMLEPGITVALTGKNFTGTWMQIAYPAGPRGRGWVTSIYLELPDITALPVLDETGAPVTTPTPDPDRPVPTATVRPASLDGDSPDSPGGQVTLSFSGTRSFTFSSELSSPPGDTDDWLSLTAVSPSGGPVRLALALECEGDAEVQTFVTWNGETRAGPACGQENWIIELQSGQAARMQLSAGAGGPGYARYTLRAQIRP